MLCLVLFYWLLQLDVRKMEWTKETNGQFWKISKRTQKLTWRSCGRIIKNVFVFTTHLLMLRLLNNVSKGIAEMGKYSLSLFDVTAFERWRTSETSFQLPALMWQGYFLRAARHCARFPFESFRLLEIDEDSKCSIELRISRCQHQFLYFENKNLLKCRIPEYVW